MLLRILSVFCALFYSTIVFAVEPSPFVRRTEPQIPSYLLRKPEVYNPFKGMFQNWEKRKTKREAANERVNTYIRELIRFYPGSNPDYCLSAECRQRLCFIFTVEETGRTDNGRCCHGYDWAHRRTYQ